MLSIGGRIGLRSVVASSIQSCYRFQLIPVDRRRSQNGQHVEEAITIRGIIPSCTQAALHAVLAASSRTPEDLSEEESSPELRQLKMEEFTREFLNQRGNEDLSVEEFHLKLGEYMERRGRAAAPTAPMETAAAPPRSIGMFMPSTVPELRGRENLPTFLQRFRTWASISGCDSALDSEIIVRTSGTPRAELERVHDPRLVDISLNAWQSLTKALEKEQELLKMVIRIGSISEAWRALTKIANASEEVEYDRAKREFETLEMDASESVAEFFTRVHVILMELERHQIPIPDREIQRIVLGSLSPRFPHETSMHAYKGECDLKDLETGLARVEKFRSDQIKKGASPHALAAAYTGSGGAGAGGGTRGRGKRSGRRSGKRQDDGRDEQQQQQQQSATWQQQQSAPWQQQQSTPMAAAAVTPMAAATDTCMAATPAACMAATPAATVTCTAAAAAAISTAATTASRTTPTAVQPVGQLGEPARSTVPERSAPSKETTASGTRTAALAACHVSAVRRG